MFMTNRSVRLGRNCCKNFVHVNERNDVCIFVAIILFGEKAAWVHQAHDTEQLNLFYVIIGLTHYEKPTSCT